MSCGVRRLPHTHGVPSGFPHTLRLLSPYNLRDSPNKTIAKVGAKTVIAKEVKTSVGRVTTCLTVCADGTKLPPLVIFKGAPGKTVEKENKDYPKDAFYTVQENAWTDERVMLYWIDKVLKPYVEKAPRGVVPYLLLDKYRCHYQGSVAQEIEKLGVEWDIIPGGCTGLIQPIDVGIGKPFKHRIRYWLEDWLCRRESHDRIPPKEARTMIANWACASWNRTKKEIIYNSWRNDPFSYFPDEPSLPHEYESDSDYDGSSSEEEDDPNGDNGSDVVEPI